MDIIGMVTRLPTLVFGASRCDDSFADRLSYKYTVLVLVLFAIIVTNKQFGTKHIQCKREKFFILIFVLIIIGWVPAQFTKNYEVNIDYYILLLLNENILFYFFSGIC
jgi:hypothetical protein